MQMSSSRPALAKAGYIYTRSIDLLVIDGYFVPYRFSYRANHHPLRRMLLVLMIGVIGIRGYQLSRSIRRHFLCETTLATRATATGGTSLLFSGILARIEWMGPVDFHKSFFFLDQVVLFCYCSPSFYSNFLYL